MSAASDAAALLDAAPCNTVLPAGTGKTEILAHACGQLSEAGSRTLFLTHTNAGVEAFRMRLRRLGFDSPLVDIRTISSWCESWCRSYPILAAIDPERDGNNEFERYIVGAGRVLRSSAIQRVVRETWQVAMVDEYQDCTIAQHDAVCALEEVIQVVIVGDPLQSVFDFNSVVDWDAHVDRRFARLQLEWLPHRWATSNPDLGADLLEVRELLESSGSIDFRTLGAIRWVSHSNAAVAVEVRRVAEAVGSSIVIHKHRQQCVSTAKSAGGRLEAIEDVNRSSLMSWSAKMDAASPTDRMQIVANEVRNCASKLPSEFASRVENIAADKDVRFRSNSVLGPFSAAIQEARKTGSRRALFELFERAAEFPEIVIARREHWNDVRATLLAAVSADDQPFATVSAQVRGRRRNSAAPDQNVGIVATPLLVKGLEYDHVLVVNAQQLSLPELYVAMTRACISLTVISGQPVIGPNS